MRGLTEPVPAAADRGGGEPPPAPGRPGPGLRTWLVLLALVASLPLLASGVHQIAVEYPRATAAALADLDRQAAAVAGRLDAHFARLDTFLRTVATAVGDQLHDMPAVERKLSEIRAASGVELVSVGIVAPDGSVLALASDGPIARGAVNLRDRDYFAETTQSRRLAVGEPIRSRFADRWVVVAARPLLAPDGTLRAVVIAAHRLESLSRLLAPDASAPGAQIAAASGAGRLVARWPDAATDPLRVDWLARSGAPQGARLERDATGREILAAHARTLRAPWTVRVARPRDELLMHARDRLRLALGSGACILAFTLAGAWWLGRRILGPLERLRAATVRLADGDLAYRLLPEGDRETAALGRDFNRMAAQLEAERRGLEEAEHRWQFALDAAEAGVWEWRRAARRLVLSERLRAMLAEPGERVAISLRELRSRIHPDDWGEVGSALARLLGGGSLRLSVEHRLRRPDGGWLWVHTRATVAAREASGRPARIIGLVTDIDARKHADLERRALLREKKQLAEQLRLQFAHMPIACAIRDLDLRVVDCNRAFERTFGYSRAELVGHSQVDPTVSEDVRATVVRRIAPLRDGAEVVTAVSQNRTADGRTIVCEWYNTPIRDGSGVVVAIMTMAIDATERRAAEAALRESEGRFRALTRLSSDWYWEQNEDHRFVRVDSTVLGRGESLANAMLGKAPWEMAGVEPSGADWSVHRAALDRREPFFGLETRRHDAHGKVRWMSSSGEPVFDASGVFGGYRGVTRDVTERKLAEEAVRESERRYRTLFEVSPDGIAIVREGRIVQANAALARVLRHAAPATLTGREWADLFVERERDEERDRMAALGKAPGEGSTIERQMLAADGGVVEVIAAGASYEAAGGMEIQVVARDITVKKRIHERVLQINAELERRVEARTAELSAANRELEAFSYSVAHDLRSPLRAIDGYCRLIEAEHGGELSESGHALFARVRRNAGLMARLIEDLLEYSRIGRRALDAGTVDLRRLVRSIAGELLAAYPRTRLTIGRLPRVRGDSVLLRQALANLLGNAFKFSGKAEAPKVAVGCRDAGDEYVLHVRDNGVGFSMDYAHKLFGVFQRLHGQAEFEGTGVGLAIVARAIQRHGGRVWADSAPDRGATFYVALPK